MVDAELPHELLITLESTGRPTNLTLTEQELHVVSIDSSEFAAPQLRESVASTDTRTSQLHAPGALSCYVKVSSSTSVRAGHFEA